MKRISKGRILGASLVLLGIWFVIALLSLNIGSVPIPVRTSLRLLGGFFLGDNSGGDPLASVLFSVRLPRILLGSLVGAALATAGAAFQALLRNPLADPYVLGVSTGASMGTILYSILAGWLGFAAAGGGMIYARPLAAFLGAVFTVWAVYVIAGSSYRASESSQRLLLAGIVLASFLSSINVFLLTSTSKADIRGIFYWLIGDLSRPVDASIYPVTALVFGGFFLIYLFSQSLNLIGMGETDAMVLGVEVKRIRTCVYVIASLITGAVVSVSGPIAYIGLDLPAHGTHDVRQRQPHPLPHRIPLRRHFHPFGGYRGKNSALADGASGWNCYGSLRRPPFHLSAASQRRRDPMSEGIVMLEARHVSFDYHRPILRDISFSLKRGTVTGIIGPNGSGKTTILRVLDGIVRPLSGEVVLHGEQPLAALKRKEIARYIAMVPQNGGVYHYQTVFQFAIQGRSPHLSLLGFETTRDEEIALEALEMTQLTPYLDSRVSEISGGEKQRLLLARALAQQTEILLLDEFTANLDINYQVELMRLVQRITRERNLATLVVSHEINLLGTFCDAVILMSQGTICYQGSIQEVLTQEHLKQIFGLDFSVRSLPGGKAEVLPIINKEEPHEN